MQAIQSPRMGHYLEPALQSRPNLDHFRLALWPKSTLKPRSILSILPEAHLLPSLADDRHPEGMDRSLRRLKPRHPLLLLVIMNEVHLRRPTGPHVSASHRTRRTTDPMSAPLLWSETRPRIELTVPIHPQRPSQ
jgi:hypothetical protein